MLNYYPLNSCMVQNALRFQNKISIRMLVGARCADTNATVPSSDKCRVLPHFTRQSFSVDAIELYKAAELRIEAGATCSVGDQGPRR